MVLFGPASDTLAVLASARSVMPTVASASDETGLLLKSSAVTVALLTLSPPGAALVVALKRMEITSNGFSDSSRFQSSCWPATDGSAAAPVTVVPLGRVMVVQIGRASGRE